MQTDSTQTLFALADALALAFARTRTHTFRPSPSWPFEFEPQMNRRAYVPGHHDNGRRYRMLPITNTHPLQERQQQQVLNHVTSLAQQGQQRVANHLFRVHNLLFRHRSR